MERGFIDWLIVKFSLLLVGATLLVVFFLLVDFHFYFANRDTASKNLYNIENVIDSVCSSPYNLTTTYAIGGDSISCGRVDGRPVLYYSRNGVSGRKYVLCCFLGGSGRFSKLVISKTGKEVVVSGVS